MVCQLEKNELYALKMEDIFNHPRGKEENDWTDSSLAVRN